MTFNPDANGTIYAIAIQPDGKILVGGNFTNIGGLTRNRLARLNPDGTLDYAFNPNVDGTVKAIALQSTGQILIGGSFLNVGGISSSRFARLNANGTKDTTFNASVNGVVESLLVLPGDSILVGGSYSFINGSSRNNLAWLYHFGSVNTSFTPNPNGAVYSLIQQPDGKFLAGGIFTTISGTSRNRIARFNTDGTLDTGFISASVPGTNVIYTLALQLDGKILAGGFFSYIGDAYPLGLYRLNTDGTLDSSFKPKANATYAIAVQADGKILIGGTFTTVNGQSRGYFTRLFPDGSLDADFTPQANNAVQTIVKQAADKFLVGGNFTSFDGMPRNRMAILKPDLVAVVAKDYTTSSFGTYIQIFEVNVLADPPAGGEVSGKGIYPQHTILTVLTEALPGYNFVNWTDDGSIVTTVPSFSFNVQYDRTLIANFTPDPPAAFAKTAPVDSAVDEALSPTLSWGSSTRADTYEYCLDTTDNITCDATWVSVGDQLSASLSDLGINTTYYWQVRAVNVSGTIDADGGTWWSFSTVKPPTAEFSGVPLSGLAPVAVQFTDESTVSPTGWAWYFGDEAFDGAWVQKTAGAGWSKRSLHSSVVLPDGSILLTGGLDGQYKSDVWRSTDQGASWSLVTSSPGWVGRSGHSTVVLPDGSIVLMGGFNSDVRRNDVWRSTDNGVTWTQMTEAAGWTARYRHTSVALSDGSIILMGGHDQNYHTKNDVWRSTDQGATWTQLTANAPWPVRQGHNSVVLSDSSIVLIGGKFPGGVRNDVWRSTDNAATWSQMVVAAEWGGRSGHSSVVLPDDSIVLMGGSEGWSPTIRKNDVWRSTDHGATWFQITDQAGWLGRNMHTGVALPDGSIVLMGGYDGNNRRNDVWRWETASSYEQNPLHTYTEPGAYSVALLASNAYGFDSMIKNDYITVVGPPADFGKIAPENGALNQPLSLVLSWEDSDRADTYEYCIDTIDNDLCDESWNPVGDSTSANVSGLATSTTYFWQVRAINVHGTTDADGRTWWSFSTIPDAPASFNKSLPLDGAIDTSLTPTLSWAASSGAASYEYCLGSAASVCDFVDWMDVGLNTTVTLPGLVRNTTYYWQVRAVNPGGTTLADSGTWWSFTTIPDAPAAFGKSSPIDGAVNQSLSPTLTWGTSVGAVRYEYCLGSSVGMCDYIDWTDAGVNTSVTLSGLATSTHYNWQVRAINSGGTTYADSDVWWTFDTQPDAPAAFGKSSPADGAVDQPLSLTLTWESSTGVNSYEYCVDTSDDNACDGSWVSVGGNTSAGLSGLDFITTYYWQVRAINPGGTTEASAGAWWSFTTLPDAPGDFGKIEPGNGAVNQSISPTLSWHASSVADSYQYCLGSAAGVCDIEDWTNVGVETTVTLSELVRNTTHYWQVQAINPGGTTEANAGAWWSFTTIPDPPGAFTKGSPAEGAVDLSLTPTLSWHASSGVDRYEYCLGSASGSCDLVPWSNVGANTTAEVSDLDYSTTYFWQVQAINPGGTTEANAGAWWSFTTVSETNYIFLPLILR